MASTPFGPYELVQLLGRDGASEVWRAHDTVTDRIVAINVAAPQFAKDDDFVQRFRREAELATRLNEPHAVPIHGYGEIDGRLYMDMRLIEGRSLETVMRDGPLAPARAVRVIELVAQVLHAGHKVGLVHRVVRPSKLLLNDDDVAYLVDFGIAWRVHQDVANSELRMGHFNYIAPERFSRNADVGASEDIYALTCVLYECLTGSPPYRADSIEHLVIAHLMEPPPRPSETEPRVPAGFDAVIAKGMAKSPGKRYGTAVELAQAAREAITPPPGQAPSDAKTVLIPESERPTLTISLKKAARTAVTRPVRRARRMTLVPFTGLADPSGVAVDSGGTVYVTDSGSARVVGLRSGSTAQFDLPFPDLGLPSGVAVDVRGTVYVTDSSNDRVVSLAAGSTTQSVLPFTHLQFPADVAVDGEGTVYVTDFANHRVVALAAGSRTQTVLPFSDLRGPSGIAVDSNRTVYVADKGATRVVALAAGSDTQTVLPFTGLLDPAGVAVDGDRTVYVADYEAHWVAALAVGSTTQEILPVTGLQDPWGVAADRTGAVFITDICAGRVLKLAAK